MAVSRPPWWSMLFLIVLIGGDSNGLAVDVKELILDLLAHAVEVECRVGSLSGNNNKEHVQLGAV